MVASGSEAGHPGAGGAWAESALLPYLSRHTPYEAFLDRYGLVAESLLRRAASFDRVQAGLAAVRELRANLDGCFMEVVQWGDVELMWIFSEAADAGLPMDAIEPVGLREQLAALRRRLEDRGSVAHRGEIDVEAALCALVARLVSWESQRTARLADVFRRGAGALERMLGRDAGTPVMKPEQELALVLDTDGVEYLQIRIARAA